MGRGADVEPADSGCREADERWSVLTWSAWLLGLLVLAAPETDAAAVTGATSAEPAPAGLQLRVGLATDRASFDLPCCVSGVELGAAADGWVPRAVGAAVRVEPAPAAVAPPVLRLQVAALKDERAAQRLADELSISTSLPADAVFDAGTDLYRVRVGRFGQRADAEALRERLRARGVVDTWIASEGGRLEQPALAVRLGGEVLRVPGRVVDLEAGPGGDLPFGKRRYRGTLRLYLNDRGLLNVVNLVSLEDYLRGVVPLELGPEEYAEIEALKAQAVAARTYALRNLGEFAVEGYDICATPRCQVYGGRSVEHPRSDRAIAETAGQVLISNGELVDALFSATCGGHTEDVAVVFPEKSSAYLRGVPCIEGNVTRLGANAAGELPSVVVQSLLGPARGDQDRVADLESRLRAVAGLAGLPAPATELESERPEAVRHFVATTFDLVLDPTLLRAGEPRAAATYRQAELDLQRRLQGAGASLSAADRDAVLFDLSELSGALAVERGSFIAASDRFLLVRLDGRRRELAMGSGLATFGVRGDSAHPIELLPGDPVTVYRHDQRLLALRGGDWTGSFPAAKRRSAWRYFRSRDELARLVAVRYPGFELRDLEVLERGVSNRVAKLRLVGRDGSELILEGLAVRWALDVPDTRFEVRAAIGNNGKGGWVFAGSGHGHGVGMCQVGAYGMAVRGARHGDILQHYYDDVHLARIVE